VADSDERAQELDYLGGKVYQAKELIGRLRESNRVLSARLEEVEHRLQTAESGSQEPAPARGEEVDPSNRELIAEVKRLRKERRVIRDRVSKLLERIESLDL
jgi:uncharacterized coiled-coil DUF342 family protein